MHISFDPDRLFMLAGAILLAISTYWIGYARGFDKGNR